MEEKNKIYMVDDINLDHFSKDERQTYDLTQKLYEDLIEKMNDFVKLHFGNVEMKAIFAATLNSSMNVMYNVMEQQFAYMPKEEIENFCAEYTKAINELSRKAIQKKRK